MAEPAAALAEPEAEWAYRQGQGGRGPPTPPDAAPRLSVEGFEGPLDFLLEMVRRHQLDLAPLSIVSLTDQFLAALEAGAGRVPLERRGDWVVMASQLVLLKAQLLCPISPAAAEAAEAEAARRLGQLEELGRMRAAAAWLAARPQLGMSVFARGLVEPRARPQAELYVGFLEATLAMLEGQDAPGTAPPTYQPAPVELWRVPEAIERIIRLLREQPDGLPLARCLPVVPPEAADRPLRLRAALASTLVAGLELAREGKLEVDQASTFGAILLRAHPGGAIQRDAAA
jgi:segregation and condensation protein A